jgi:hypothetical protein
MNETVAAQTESVAVEDGWEWAHVEIMGHREHWGRTRQEERFGSKMLRVDVPVIKRAAEFEVGAGAGSDPKPAALTIEWQTHFYSGAAIFSYRPTDEATVMLKNKPYESPYRTRYRPEPELISAPDRGQTMEEAAADNFGLTLDDLDEEDDDDGDDPEGIEGTVALENEWKDLFVLHLVEQLQTAGVTVDPSLAAERAAADKAWKDREEGSTPAFAAQIHFEGLMESADGRNH